MSKNREESHKNIDKPGKIRQIYRKNLKNFEKQAKTTNNIEKTSKI